MAGTKKPKTVPATPWPAAPDAIHQEGTWIWLPLKGEWRDSTGKPEELVRQKFIRHLCENYGYALEQMRQEMRMISGSRSARADIVIWETPAKAAAGPGVSPVLVIECKAESVEISFGDWTPITVHLTGEISARDRTAPYKGSMFAAYPGDIVFSKIDARSGAIGMLPAEIGKAVVTPEFPVFTADPARLDGEFVKLVLRTGGFIEALRRKASGTSGRKRITPEAFQDLRIPLPPLPEQQAIVAAWRAALDKSASLEQEAAEAEAKAAEAFEAALGFAPPTPLPDRPVFVASFKDN